MPTYTGTSSAETIDGSAGDDLIDGRGGEDLLRGLGGDDVFVFRSYGVGTFVGGDGHDLFGFESGFQSSFSASYRDFYRGFSSFTLTAGTGGEVLFLTQHPETDGSFTQTVTRTATLQGIEAASFRFTDATPVPPPDEFYLFLRGLQVTTYSARDVLTIGDLTGTSLTAPIVFDGGTGDDWLNASEAVNQIIGEGGTGNDRLQGGSADDQLSGGEGEDILTGGGGVNLLDGGAGLDTVDYASIGNGVHIDLNDGTTSGIPDTLISIEHVIGGAFDDVLIGEASNNRLFGNGGSDYLIGLDGDDYLSGGTGASNTLQGGLGDDLYVVDANDTLIENAGEGTDSVRTSLSVFRLKDNLEHLTYTGSTAFTGLGNAAGNEIYGGEGGDTLMGYGGNDLLYGGAGAANTLIGGLGDDYYISRAVGDSMIEQAGEGHDTVDTTRLTYVLRDNFEDLIFTLPGAAQVGFTGTGNALGNLIRGNNGIDVLSGLAGDDVLRGMEAADTLRGGAGNDILDGGPGFDIDTADYSTAAAGATVNLNSGAATNDGDGGADTLIAIEDLIGSAFNDTLIGSAGVNVLRGGLGADTLIGLGGNDILDGGAGAANTLIGGLGDDTYRVSSFGNTIVENAGEGVDTVEATVASVTLHANIENLRFTGVGSFTGTGNASANRITGGDGADLLSGMDGDDILEGGDGPDTFRGGAGNDTFVGGGTGGDAADYTLAGSAVRVDLTKTQVLNDGDGGVDTLLSIESATGSAFDDVLIGNSGPNVLNGGLGRDTLLGGQGDDVLMGGSGVANTLQGGFGNDRYVVSAVGDSIVEFADQGTDLVQTALASMTLAANLENLTYTGAGAFTGNGNASNNIVTSGAGDDTLSGRGGNDIISAGGGIDTMVMSGVQSDYAVNAGAGYHSISDTVAGRDGLDILYGVERVRFSDGTVVDLTAAPAPALPSALEVLLKTPAGLVPRLDDLPLTVPDPGAAWNEF